MAAGTALGYYSDAARFIMDSKDISHSYFLLLKEALAPLRFYLACRVCNNLLQEPMSPDHTACQHTVCSQCIGGKMKLKPLCGWCKSYENFKPNKTLAALLGSYSKLCDYTLSSTHYMDQLKNLSNDTKPDLSEMRNAVAEILAEGSQYSCQSLALNTNGSPNLTLISTVTTEPTDPRPGIKLTIRNPFKNKSTNKPSTAISERKNRGLKGNSFKTASSESTTEPLQSHGCNLTTLSLDNKPKRLMRKAAR